jgi:glycosyltransferase involved in cell wall biosynthesis
MAVTLHTVVASPVDRQREILEGLGAAAHVLVVMSEHAAERLLGTYEIDPGKVHIIPHGAQPFPFHLGRLDPHRRPTVVNWGLIGPGKGLEWAIQAIDRLRRLEPRPRLVIHGTTHPNVKRREGEAYRDQLVGLVDSLGLDDSVEILDGYMTSDELRSLIQGADLALLPYDTTDQVTSGVLVDAIGAGLPVVATAFPRAQEVLSSGAGRVVAHRDPDAMAGAIEDLLTHPPALKAAAEEARRVGRQFAWPRVALQYERLARTILTMDNKSVA